MKSDDIKLDQDLNRQIWTRGKTHPPRKVRVKMVKDEDGVVTVSLYEDVPAPTEAPIAAENKPKVTPTETTAAADAPKEEAKTEAAK